ncbi:hypothetical protein HGM15179_018528 [Zosterops borbonicus]|uniref:Uncharacterized protein n=1 Tax=Zosterops borbonicus TaxID=364589 RepID=A0A8K1FYU5_9PASS|nr:hypothetical protein HGM15179_018528 [Zosterops borbonicus]
MGMEPKVGTPKSPVSPPVGTLKVSLPTLPAEVEWAKDTLDQAWVALVALAEALVAPGSIPTVLDQAKAVLGQAQVALKGLEVARKALVAPAVALGTLGDEDPEWLQKYGASFEAAAAALECEERRARRCQRRFRTGHELAMGMMVLCAAVLSLDSVRAALGVAEDSHLLLALATVVVSCQVAWQGLGTSRRHLATAADNQRDVAQRLRHRAGLAVKAKDNAKSAMATNEATAAVLGQLEKVTLALETLVAAVTQDREVTPWGTQGQGFPNAAQALEDILVDLRESGQGHGEMARRLEVAWRALVGQGQGQGQDGDTGVALSPPWHGDTRVTLGTLGTPHVFPLGTPGPP